MTKEPKPLADSEAERLRIMRSRNRMLLLVLVGFVILTFAISIVKMS